MSKLNDDKIGSGQGQFTRISGQGTPNDSGAEKVSREARGSGGGARPAVTDETRDGTAETNNSISSRLSMRELSFDLDQPWQRSLRRELENIERSVDEKHARPRPHKILLGRGHSGDYLIEYDDDDDLTVMTEATGSSSMPLRPQTIHRTVAGAHVALFKDEEDDESGALSTDSSTDRIVAHDPAVYRGVAGAFSDSREGRETRREDGLGPSGCIPTLALSRANALVEDRSTGTYLKSSSRLRFKLSEENSTTEPDFAGSACMCIGSYNFLDFLIPRDCKIPRSRHKKRRTSSWTSSRTSSRTTNLLRSSTGSYRSVLGRVTEEAPESIFVFRDDSRSL